MFDWNRFHPRLQRAVTHSQEIAARYNTGTVEPAHLLLALLDEIEAENEFEGDVQICRALLSRCGTSVPEVRAYTEAFLEGETGTPSDKPQLSNASNFALRTADDQARLSGRSVVELEHLLLGVLHPRAEPQLAQMLEPLHLTFAGARNHVHRLQQTARPHAHLSPLAHLSEGGTKALDAAHAAMRATYCGRISTLHLLLGILADENSLAVAILRESDVDVASLAREARAQVRSDGQLATTQQRFTEGAKLALERARDESQAMQHTFIGPEHLLLGLFPRSRSLRERMLLRGEIEADANRVLAPSQEEGVRARLYAHYGLEVKPVAPKRGGPTPGSVRAFVLCLIWGLFSPLLGVALFGSYGEFLGSTNILYLGFSGLLASIQFTYGSRESKWLWLGVFSGLAIGMMLSILCGFFSHPGSFLFPRHK